MRISHGDIEIVSILIEHHEQSAVTYTENGPMNWQDYSDFGWGLDDLKSCAPFDKSARNLLERMRNELYRELVAQSSTE